MSIGTIFSIYRRKTEEGTKAQLQDVLQLGSAQVAAGYILYGSSTMLVFTTGAGVNGFTYEPSLGEYILSHQDMTIPKGGKIYSINEGSYHSFQPEVKAYVEKCKDRGYSARYIGSLVADFHRNLLKGGIYIYPATANSPNGKLRLMYEANPLAFIAEQAGGKATDGEERLMEKIPTSLHERTPLIMGSSKEVDKVTSFISSKK